MKKILAVVVLLIFVSEFLAVQGVKGVSTDAPTNVFAYSNGTTVYIKWTYSYPSNATECYMEITHYTDWSGVWKTVGVWPGSPNEISLSSQPYGRNQYSIRARYKISGVLKLSDFSNLVDAYVLHPVTGLTVTVNPDVLQTQGNPYLTLKWDTVDSNAQYVDIWRDGPDGAYILETLPSSNTTFVDTTVLPNRTYEYAIEAFRKDETNTNYNDISGYSPKVSKLTLPAAPTNFKAYFTGKTLHLSWTHSKDCDGYKIYKWIQSGILVSWSLIGTVDKNTLSYESSVFDYGGYTLKVTAYNASGDSPQSPRETAYALSTPTGLTATPLSSNSIKLSFNSLDSNATQLVVSISKSGGASYKQSFNLPASSVTITSLTPDTEYSFSIAAKRDSNESDYTPLVTAKTLQSGTPPNKPTGIGAVALACNKVEVRWYDNSNNEDGFKIERKEGSGSYSEIGTAPANSSSYTDSTVTAGKTYYYRVRSYNAYGNSDYTTEVNVTIPSCDTDIYSTGMITVRGTFSCDLDLGKETGSWDPPTDFFWEQTTDVERYIDPMNGAKFYVVGNVNFDSITHSTLKTYSYSADKINGSNDASNKIPTGTVVAAITDEGRYSKFKIEVYGYDLIIKFVTYKENEPSAPSNLTATATSCNNVNLSFSDNSNNESGFKIERKESGGTYSEIATVPTNTTTYADTTVQAQKTYYYRVRAYNAYGNSSYTNEVNVTTPACGTIPNKPTNLSASALSTTEIKLTWSDNSDNEDGFKLERKEEGGTYAEIKTLSANTTSYTDTGLKPNTKYYYRIRAYNSVGYSDYSNEANATTMKPVETIIISLYVGKTTYYVNDVKKELDAAPIIRENRTLLPIRVIIEALGGTIDWDAKEQKVTINFKGTTIELWIGKNTARVNGEYKLIDPTNPKVTPVIIPPGRTMLPIRFIAENLGCLVGWDDALKEVKITYPAP